MYSGALLEHFRNPRNVGEIPDADAQATVGNPACGDIMRLYLKIQDGKIRQAKFKTFGCGAAIATSSMATVMLTGKTLEEAEKITKEEIASALGGLPPFKMHCSVLAVEAIQAALRAWRQRAAGSPSRVPSPLAGKGKG